MLNCSFRRNLLNGMFQKMNKGSDSANTNGAMSIEQTYQKKSQLEHILLRPDTYIGSVQHLTEQMWIYDTEAKCMVNKQITYVPGLYKIFDEILVNAADNKQRDSSMDCIKIEIEPEENKISVWNNGQGIPVVMHKEEKMYVPTMIFGHLLTSSNYNDEEAKVTGGRNGYGAKLCNIFSKKFIVETSSREYKRKFKQTWTDNMGATKEASVSENARDTDYTKITFYPDLSKFSMEKLDDDIVGLMRRRAYDVAASTRGVKVFLNGERLSVKNFKDYIDLYLKSNEDEESRKVVYETVSDRWEVAFCLSNNGFQQVSFVNSIATTKGGRHVDYIADMIVKQAQEILKKKNKGGVAIKPHQIKNHMWVFINCLIVNPTFDSQTKENMTSLQKNFGSKATLSEKFIGQVVKSGLVEHVLSWAKFKAQTELNKVGGRKQTKVKGVPKLEDANEAGGKNALKCTLILTEGDSAKSLAVSGLGVIGRDYYGVFPLRGKLLNVREATHKQILENAEINNLVKIVGLQYKKKYNTEEDLKTLRYGKIMIMTDQDQDGSHIKGLLINFVHCNWPELLRLNFLEQFITPIVKATKRNEELSFYSLPEFEEWKSNTANYRTYSIKYYKGLGTSTSKEAKEYFTNMERHRIKFTYGGQRDDDHILLAFSKKHIEHRKEWLTNFMVENRRLKELGLPEKYLYTKTTKSVTYTDFINLEFILYSNADNIRSLPCIVDGMKPGQRKVLFTCIKRNDKKEVKVAQLAGSVAEKSAYHHGEVSLCSTIVALAQNFVGSNNINLLEPRGQFGTRLAGGKDCASPRYIFTKMSPLTRLIFHPHDDPLLKYEFDDNLKIEPQWYCPIIPMLLVNGADGIGTGWMTKIPNYNPRDLVQAIRAMIDGRDPPQLHPWYKNFKGTVESVDEHRYVTSGEVAVTRHNCIEITELPVGTWTQVYKENVLEVLMNGSDKVKALISDYKEYNTDTTVKMTVSIIPSEFSNIEKEGFHKVFKLQNSFTLSSMCVFDHLGCLRRMENVMDIMREFYTLRLKMYTKRKEYLEGMLEAEANKLSNQARFIMEKCDGTLVVENKKRKIIIQELISKGFKADPVLMWKESQKEDDEEEGGEVDEDGNSSHAAAPTDTVTENKKFDYLLGMSIWMLTDERKSELLRQRDEKIHELKTLQAKSNSDLWREDLDVFMKKLDEVEEAERREEANVPKGKGEKKGLASRKKLVNMNETMPSPNAKRIQPTISDEMKKKFIAAGAKNRPKKVLQTSLSQDTAEEADEFDNMTKASDLKKKVGTPEEAEKKAKGRKKKETGKDGLKQTKLTFTKKAENGKNTTKDGDDSDSNDDEAAVEKAPRDLPKRNVPKKIYNLDSDDDFDSAGAKDDSDEDMFSSPKAVAKPAATTPKPKDDSDDDDEVSPPPKNNESSEDMFDRMVGKSPTPVKKPPGTKRKLLRLSSDDESPKKKPAPKSKKAKTNSSGEKPKKKTTPKKKKPARSDSDSGESDDGDDDDDFVPKKPAARTARATKPSKYKFSDSDLSD
ncbi:DNA topoisomerase 2 isoform X2 [Atheta coriaria]|uniref:DNA topoisomerase 2 isoform X2 n=1 Tax=Dalotia coriaria TaxID=877792 RepID=UPI0031F37DEE